MKQPEEQLRNSRVLLNVCQGMRNIIERDVIHTEMAKVTDLIFDKLKDHYGPFSSFAGIDSNKPLEETVFTKDGANIIRSMEFISPQEDWVRRSISYIGNRMETAAGDGTTSSMMFACGMLKYLSKSIDNFRPISYIQLREAYDELVSDIKKYMMNYVMSAKNGIDEYDREKVKILAYNQAYTSSHGNVELAEAVSDMFANTPSSMWSKMGFGRRTHEYDKPFEILKTEHQYEMEADIWNKSMYNKDAGAWLELEKATLIVINDTLMYDSVYWKTIREEIEKSTKEVPLVILCRSGIDNATWGELTEYAAGRNGKTRGFFTVFTAKAQHGTVNDFTVVQALAGADVSEYTTGNAGGDVYGKPYIIRDVYVKHAGDKLEFDNLYQDDREKVDYVRERPMVHDTSKPFYSEFMESIQSCLDGMSMFDLNHSQLIEFKYLEKMYNNLRYDKRLTLYIGGNTFDNIAMFDVVDDVIRATIKSLENGVVISNNKTLYKVMNELIDLYEDTENNKTFNCCNSKQTIKKIKLKKWIAVQVINTLKQFAGVMLNMLYPKGKNSIEGMKPNGFLRRIDLTFSQDMNSIFGYIPRDQFYYDSTLYMFTKDELESWVDWWFDTSVDVLKYNNSKWWILNKDSDGCYPIENTMHKGLIVQPANADIVMLERFGEIALRFILTERVIVSGAAYINDKELKK